MGVDLVLMLVVGFRGAHGRTLGGPLRRATAPGIAPAARLRTDYEQAVFIAVKMARGRPQHLSKPPSVRGFLARNRAPPNGPKNGPLVSGTEQFSEVSNLRIHLKEGLMSVACVVAARIGRYTRTWRTERRPDELGVLRRL